MNAKLKRSAFATLLGAFVVVAALALLPGRAGAVDITFDYGAQAVPNTLYWGPLALNHGPSQSFTDHILFSTSSPFFASFIDNFNTFSNFASLTATLYSTTGPTLVHSATANTPVAGYSWVSSAPSGVLAAGSYDVRLTGTMAASITPNPTGESGGIILAAIPEPETYAMMLAGLGLMGFVMRRRKAGQPA